MSLIRGSLHWTHQIKGKLYFYSSAYFHHLNSYSVVGKYCKSECSVSLNFLSIFFFLSLTPSLSLYTGENSTTVSENSQGYIFFSLWSLLIIPVFALAFFYIYNRAQTNHRIVELISMKSLSSVS